MDILVWAVGVFLPIANGFGALALRRGYYAGVKVYPSPLPIALITKTSRFYGSSR